MSWLKIESSVARNKKFMKAGPAPSWLWVCGLAYCQEGLTDGFIPTEALPYLGVKNAKQLASHLVKAGLWDETKGGWNVHDYLSHNRSSSEIGRIREERRHSGMRGGEASGERRRSNLLQHVEANPTDASKQPSNPATATATATETATDQQVEVRVEPPSDSTPAVLTFPTVGKCPSWVLTQGRIDGWLQSYPNVDVAGECRKASAWIEANPERRKTAKGMSAFLVNWLNRAADRPARRVEPAPQGMAILSAEETRKRYLTQ